MSPTSTKTNVIPVMMRIAVNIQSMGAANVEACGGSHQVMERLPLFRREGQVRRLRLRRLHRHRRRLRAVLLMPRLDRIRPGGKALDAVAAVRAGRRIEGMR